MGLQPGNEMDGPENTSSHGYDGLDGLPPSSVSPDGVSLPAPPGDIPPVVPPTDLTPSEPNPDPWERILGQLRLEFGQFMRGEMFPQLARSQQEQIEGSMAELGRRQESQLVETRNILQSSLDGAIANLGQQIQPVLQLGERVAGLEAQLAQAGQARQQQQPMEPQNPAQPGTQMPLEDGSKQEARIKGAVAIFEGCLAVAREQVLPLMAQIQSLNTNSLESWITRSTALRQTNPLFANIVASNMGFQPYSLEQINAMNANAATNATMQTMGVALGALKPAMRELGKLGVNEWTPSTGLLPGSNGILPSPGLAPLPGLGVPVLPPSGVSMSQLVKRKPPTLSKLLMNAGRNGV